MHHFGGGGGAGGAAPPPPPPPLPHQPPPPHVPLSAAGGGGEYKRSASQFSNASNPSEAAYRDAGDKYPDHDLFAVYLGEGVQKSDDRKSCAKLGLVWCGEYTLHALTNSNPR